MFFPGQKVTIIIDDPDGTYLKRGTVCEIQGQNKYLATFWDVIPEHNFTVYAIDQLHLQLICPIQPPTPDPFWGVNRTIPTSPSSPYNDPSAPELSEWAASLLNSIDNEDRLSPNTPPYVPKRCECGVSSIGGGMHSTWCPLVCDN